MTAKRRGLSLSTSVPAAVFLVGIVAFGLFSWHSVANSLRSLESAEQRLAQITGLSTSAAIEASLRRGDTSEARRAVERANALRNLTWAAYVDGDGMIAFASRIELVGKRSSSTELSQYESQIAEVQRAMRGRVFLSADRRRVIGVFPALVDSVGRADRATRNGTYVQGLDIGQQREAVLRTAMVESAIGGGLLVLLSLLLWLFLRRLLISRIERVNDFADTFERTNEVPPIEVGGGDEIAKLARRLERMATTLVERSRLLRESQKMEAVGRLAGGVAHDFNNLLTVILGNTEFALHTLRGRDGDRQLRDVLAEVEHAGRSASGLIRQLLAFSRQGVTQRHPLALAPAISAMSSLLDRVLGPQHKLTIDLAPECIARIDPTQLEQVVLNLVVNSCDAMPDGGRITIRCEPFADPSQPSVPGVHLSIADTGSGISEEQQEQIFEPFFTTKPLGAGTGLGLATVYMIIQDSGGRIEVESTAMGTTFHVYLPGTDEPVPAEDDSASPADTSRSGTKAMLCEDNAAVRRVTAGMLREANFEVAEAGSGEEALGWLSSNPVDVLVTDVLMPGMNGLELARQVQARQPSIRVVFISGYTSEVDAAAIAAFPGSRFLAKPVTAARLLAEVVALCEDSRS